MMPTESLLSLVGKLLFTWSLLEQPLSKSLLESAPHPDARPRIGGSFADRLPSWRSVHGDVLSHSELDAIVTKAEELKAERNLVVHGLASWSELADDGIEAFIGCVLDGWADPDGTVRKITASQLEETIAAMDRLRRGFERPMVLSRSA